MAVKQATILSPETVGDDLFERDDELMADKSFKIPEDLLFHFCR